MKRCMTVVALSALTFLAAGCPAKQVRTTTVREQTETVRESRIIDPAVAPEPAPAPEEPERTTETTTVRERVIESGPVVK